MSQERSLTDHERTQEARLLWQRLRPAGDAVVDDRELFLRDARTGIMRCYRGIPFTYGRFDGAEIECCYHGWRFDTEGRCTVIPSLVSGQDVKLSRINATAFMQQHRDIVAMQRWARGMRHS